MRNTDLNRARLPIPPSGLVGAHVSGQTICVNALFSSALALPVIALPATPAIGETGGGSFPLPVTIRGEDAGRQVRGGADADRVGFRLSLGARRS
ncbi:hypothetical protein MPLDJ20_200048 [Mesorhizobium plurifarium]|uniref:Uncharacterized protein n=1 Tax=Mesorhizobium plurifarium TaxID=69974 RepID=A0A090GLM0_MESPL|nr:hypothetical protein MPLDJ20_200048 [Mesorhizobium plurifarium]